MFRSLAQLHESVEFYIKQQGEDAPCAAFIFTKNDVIYYDYDFDNDTERSLNEEDTENVLIEVGDSDYIYEQINDIIEDEIRDILKKQ